MQKKKKKNKSQTPDNLEENLTLCGKSQLKMVICQSLQFEEISGLSPAFY